MKSKTEQNNKFTNKKSGTYFTDNSIWSLFIQQDRGCIENDHASSPAPALAASSEISPSWYCSSRLYSR